MYPDNYAVVDEIKIDKAVTMQIKTPALSNIVLMKDGKRIHSTFGSALTYVASEPGFYRVEVYRRFLGRQRGWIFSNPIRVT